MQKVGSGEQAFVYLRRYLYRGFIREKDILKFTEHEVTFRYKYSKTNFYKTRTVSGVEFIRLVLQHVLPRRLRRARDYGFLHPNSKALIQVLHYVLQFNPGQYQAHQKPRAHIICSCCGGRMIIVQTCIQSRPRWPAKPLKITKAGALH